ncbi:MAG: ABC transporter ATP-binding protein [Deltaproteobacteria bacterium]|nr:ABC transporter ATP-binding protein [Deltaproteobacteria bacterium]
MLKLDQLSKRFGGIAAVERVSFLIPKKKIAALIGPNGAGKTTIFNLVSGLERPSKGRIEFLGQDITDQPPHKIAALGLSRTFQNLQIFGELSVLENILTGFHLKYRCRFLKAGLWLPAVGREEIIMKRKAHEILEFVNLLDKKDLSASNLPYGDQRLLEIGRAMAMAPKLLLLDEPAAGLNNHETRLLGTKIKELNQLGITIFIVEHDMKLVMRISDEIIVLNHGQKIAQGIPKSIRDDPHVVSAYLGTKHNAAV